MKPNYDFKGIWIPKEIWLSEDLTLMEKIFLVEIDYLDKGEGCFASNSHFAKFFGVTSMRCSQVINSLVNKEFLTSEIIKEGGQIKKRILRKGIKYSLGGIKNIFRKENKVSNSSILENKFSNTTTCKVQKKITEKIKPSNFERFWELYPNKKNKGAAKGCWNKLCKKNNAPIWKELRTALKAQCKTDKWIKGGYIPLPTTWLNQERWLDDPATMVLYDFKDNGKINGNPPSNMYFDKNYKVTKKAKKV